MTKQTEQPCEGANGTPVRKRSVVAAFYARMRPRAHQDSTEAVADLPENTLPQVTPEAPNPPGINMPS